MSMWDNDENARHTIIFIEMRLFTASINTSNSSEKREKTVRMKTLVRRRVPHPGNG